MVLSKDIMFMNCFWFLPVSSHWKFSSVRRNFWRWKQNIINSIRLSQSNPQYYEFVNLLLLCWKIPGCPRAHTSLRYDSWLKRFSFNSGPLHTWDKSGHGQQRVKWSKNLHLSAAFTNNDLILGHLIIVRISNLI